MMEQKRRAVKGRTGQRRWRERRQEGRARKEKGEKPCSAVSGDEAGSVGREGNGGKGLRRGGREGKSEAAGG